MEGTPAKIIKIVIIVTLLLINSNQIYNMVK